MLDTLSLPSNRSCLLSGSSSDDLYRPLASTICVCGSPETPPNGGTPVSDLHRLCQCVLHSSRIVLETLGTSDVDGLASPQRPRNFAGHQVPGNRERPSTASGAALAAKSAAGLGWMPVRSVCGPQEINRHLVVAGPIDRVPRPPPCPRSPSICHGLGLFVHGPSNLRSTHPCCPCCGS